MKESHNYTAQCFLPKHFLLTFITKLRWKAQTVLLSWFEFSIFALQLAINRVLVLIKNDQPLDKAQTQVESVKCKENV